MENYAYSNHIPWRMLVWLMIAQLFIAFVSRSIAPLGLMIGEDLQLTKSQIGIFPAALFLGQSLISIPAGLLTDRFGSRKMLLFITLVLSGSFIVISLTSSFMLLLIFIVVSGIAYGASHPSTNRGIVYWFPVKVRGTAMGLKQMSVTLGSALAALVLLPLASNYGWQTATFSGAMSLLIVGISIFFVYYEPKNMEKKEDLNNRTIHLKDIIHLLKHVKLVLITISAMLLSGTQMILNTFIIFFAHEKIGINLLLSGVLLGIAEIGGTLGRICWGIISDVVFKGNRIIVLLLISFLVAVASIFVAILPTGVSFYVMALIVFIFGFGSAGFNGVWMNATTEIVHRSASGIATGVSITFASLGVLLFPPVFGFIVDYTGDYTFSWLFVVFLMLLSIISLVPILKGKDK